MSQDPGSALPIPQGAICRPGSIALLRGIGPQGDGRLVLVRFPVADTGRPDGEGAFAWQVLALGQPVSIHGCATRDFRVPDCCLVPVSQIDPRRADRLVKAVAMRSFDEALAELGALLRAHPLTEEQFEAAMLRALEQVAITHALEVVPIPVVLQELGFVAVRNSGGGAWHWSGVHGGVELAIAAHPMPRAGGWAIVGRCMTARTWMFDERHVQVYEPRGRVGALVLDLWRSAFGHDALPPGRLELGQRHARHQADLRRIGIGLPVLSIDGAMLRAVRRVLAMRHGLQQRQTGPLPDLPAALSHREGLLRIDAAGQTHAVEAHGVWVEDCAVSLRVFLSMSAQRLRGPRVQLQRSHAAVILNGSPLPVLEPRSTG